MGHCNDDNRDPLEVLAAEFMERQRRGENPSISEYVAQYPDLASEIEEFFPTIAAIERLKAHREGPQSGLASLGPLRLERLGDFRILGEIGRGGMGIVFEAFQESLGRHVAVKVLPRQALLDSKQLQRFQREAQTAARLHHTNIVPLFGVGEQEGIHYIVMQLIRGVGLDAVLTQLNRLRTSEGTVQTTAASLHTSEPTKEAIRFANLLVEGRFGKNDESEQSERPQDQACRFGASYWRSVAMIGMQVADALHYAHVHHTLHRDIKPANLVLDSQGIVWITDFGLAKVLDQDHVSQTGMLAGTLRYMAPEQFTGQVDARSDVYSLGLTLYELLTLQPAFTDASRGHLIHKITQERPLGPRRLNPAIPRDLETIVLKAIAREPADRYQSAADLARDLERFLEDRPISARRASLSERLWRWSRRNRALASFAASTLVLLVLVAVVASVGYLRTANQRKKAEDISALALEALDNIFQQFAPERAVPTSAMVVVDDEGEEITVPVQPVLSKEAASLLEHLLAFYDRLADQGGGDARLRRKVAAANRRVGDIRQRLGQYDESKAAYSRAIELYTRLAETMPDDVELQTEIARIHNELGNVYSATNDAGAGHAEYQNALAILKASLAESAPQYQYELARTYYFLGHGAEAELGPLPLAPGGQRRPRRGAHETGFHPHEPPSRPFSDNYEPPPGQLGPPLEIPDMPPEPPDGERGPPPVPLAGSLPTFPPFGPEERLENLQRAIRLLEQLVAKHPAVSDYRHLLARCYREVSFQPFGRSFKAGSDAANRAIAILEKLVDDYPNVPDYRHDLAQTYARMGSAPPFSPKSTDTATEKRSHEMLEKALAISRELVAEHPNVPDYALAQIGIRVRLAGLHWDNEPGTAERELREALEQQTTLNSRIPRNFSYRFGLAVIQESLAGLYLEQKRLPEARTAFEAAIAAFKDVLQNNSRAIPLHGILARNYLTLADVLKRLDKTAEAADAVHQAEALHQHHRPRKPGWFGLD